MSKKGMTVEEMMIVDELVQEFLEAENFWLLKKFFV
jgi:hypothetical protein